MLVKNAVKRPPTSEEEASYNSIFMLCEMGKELEKRVRELEAENAELKKHCEWLEGNLDLKNTNITDLKNQLRDALESC